MSAILSPGLLQFRTMLEEDIPNIMRIETKAYQHPWTGGIFRDCLRVGYFCQVLEQDGIIHGYAIMSMAVGEAHILNICVRPSSQSQGLGNLILDHLIEAARRMGAEVILLEVRPSNKAAVHLYHSHGFNEVGMRKSYYPSHDGREDALILALNL